MRWEATSDGIITIYDEKGAKKNWSGIWKAMPDGSIWTQVANKPPHELVKDGRGWTNRSKLKITLTPGRW